MGKLKQSCKIGAVSGRVFIFNFQVHAATTIEIIVCRTSSRRYDRSVNRSPRCALHAHVGLPVSAVAWLAGRAVDRQRDRRESERERRGLGVVAIAKCVSLLPAACRVHHTRAVRATNRLCVHGL